ncbi:NADH-quinone oxidoreductase subunit NuoE [Consotaella salsifontis]|uniref:NADH-quinone oxidoreductase, E subunit n=1 Tax=Consotaella salsifontis TaxID=1365950 RepID=A0A1T4LLF1_9HYPH|nr:NADH-quinone oxidoreductase subunit NuoE [Consotaella salsifontis]SJZ55552.1 NADH-quinone oxidoreductase, E subunit [Consotaella salsifontis]
MSVRRLAEDREQPDHFAFTDENARWAEQTIRKYPEGRHQSAVIPLLMRAQDQEGWVTRAAIEHVANMLGMPLIRVLEVATFYTQFQLKPVGRHAHVQVCGTTPCMLRGAEGLKEVCRNRIHHEPLHVSGDGGLSWEEVECLGACVNAPMVMIGKDTYEDLSPERLEEIIDLFAQGKGDSVPTGPQIDRHLSAPIGGPTTLTSLDDGREPAPRSGGTTSSGRTEARDTGPSKAARPETHATETAPAINGPAREAVKEEASATDDAASVDASAGAGAPASGHTGGRQEGPNDTVEQEAVAHHEAEATGGRDPAGSLAAREAVAEAAVVPDVSRPDDQPAPERRAHGPVDMTGLNKTESSVPEGRRTGTDDTTAGPAATDSFSDGKGNGGGEAGEPGLEREAPKPVGRKPELLSEPDGQKDDLKRIKGIGDVIEQQLNELGVFHIRQIAAWGQEELFWIDDHLNFRGRSIRDRWVDQAKELVAETGAASSNVGGEA